MLIVFVETDERLVTHACDPDRYLTYADDAADPFVDLVGRVDAKEVRDVSSTFGSAPATSPRCWPRARPAADVLRARRRPAVVDAARRTATSGPRAPRLEVADLRDWVATGSTDGACSDVLVPDATLHACPAAWTCCRVWSTPWHRGAGSRSRCRRRRRSPPAPIRRDLARAARVRPAHREPTNQPGTTPPTTTACSRRPAATVDVWETTGTSTSSTGPDPVFTWVSGTGARPTLQALPDLRAGSRASSRPGCARRT